jgi:hypothetical protein
MRRGETVLLPALRTWMDRLALMVEAHLGALAKVA